MVALYSNFRGFEDLGRPRDQLLLLSVRDFHAFMAFLATASAFEADDSYRTVLEHVGLDHCGVEIRVPHAFLNGSDLLPTL